jgi:diguanylate cyclase (GGDEF)-like protein
MLGADHEAKLGAFLDYLAQEPGRSAEMEAELTTPAGERRMVQVIGSNQLGTPAIDGTALTVRDVTERRRLEQVLRPLAFFDPLTLLARLATASARRRRIRDGCRPAVLFIDLDNFKAINGLGHEAGDQLLRTSAQRIVQGTRESDTVARLGGDEFAILMDDAGNVAAMQTVARGILASLAAPTLLEGRSLIISASIGMCLAGPGTTAESLLRHADTAMYRAKALGKGQAVVFETKMLETVRRRLQIEHDMKRALERGEFGIHYQPMVDMQTGHLLGVEALMRWRHARLGVMPPAEFIPIAEETGLIVPLTRWILSQECTDLSHARRTVHRGDGLRISVNVSGECLKHDAIVADVERALAESGLDASALVLEVTESLLLQGTREIGDRMAAIKRLGVRLALDDFGTGYSSLGYLHRFPVDKDGPFVRAAIGRRRGQQHDKASAFAKAILSLADALGLDTVAGRRDRRHALLRLDAEWARAISSAIRCRSTSSWPRKWRSVASC